ncbi:MAG TPA: hypothetical protein VN788_08815 [Verrucomicrobiae bacterium]|nr:hypothetical protein [Verrucomicrobiae bacterium]
MTQFGKNAKLWSSKFARFVEGYGAERLAAKLQMHPSAVYHWIRGATSPRPVHAAIIQGLARESGVRLSFEDIYHHRSHSRDLRAAKEAHQSKAPAAALSIN